MKEKTYNGRRKYYRAVEVAEMMEVKPATVYNWCTKKAIPCIKVGGSVRIPIKRFHNWLEYNTIDIK